MHWILLGRGHDWAGIVVISAAPGCVPCDMENPDWDMAPSWGGWHFSNSRDSAAASMMIGTMELNPPGARS